ncbi:hypothetical protein M569_09282, partial [Genlisea aurea]
SPALHFNRRSLSAKSSSLSAAQVPPEIDRFWQWLRDEKVISSRTPVEPAVVPEGLGLVATRDISKNDVVLEVPRRFWIHPDAVAASDIGTVCSGLKPWISVALFLIRERFKGEESQWRYYLEILPRSTNSTIYWSDEELLEIRGTQLLGTTLGVKEYVEKEFDKVEEEVILANENLFPFRVTTDDFMWAFGILRSRAFSRLRNRNLVIVPFADLLNHSAAVSTEDHAHEVGGPAGLFSWDYLFQIRSPLSLKSGDQVFIQYDLKKSNADMALDYGFIESEPGRDAFTLTLEIPESDEFYDDKLDVAESNGMERTAYFDVKYDRRLPQGMLPFLRLLALGGTDAFLLEALFRNQVWGFLQLPVSRPNEEHVCRVVRSACRDALSGYHTTVEQDEKILSEMGECGDGRLRMAVGVRRGEKRVLQQIDEMFRVRESELDSLEYYQERRMKDLGLLGQKGEIIFWET